MARIRLQQRPERAARGLDAGHRQARILALLAAYAGDWFSHGDLAAALGLVPINASSAQVRHASRIIEGDLNTLGRRVPVVEDDEGNVALLREHLEDWLGVEVIDVGSGAGGVVR